VSEEQTNKNGKSLALLRIVVVVAALRFARSFLIPVVLAVLLAFILAPLANLLRRTGVRQCLSNATVVLLSFIVLGGLGSLIATQLVGLGRQIPAYQVNIDKKMASIRASSGGIVKRISSVAHDFSEELTPASPPSAENKSGGMRPVPVEVRQMPFSPVAFLQTVLGSVVDFLIMFVVVIVFVIFMLGQREDLRERLLRLGRERQPSVTSTMLDEAANRVSRYLLAQLAVNAAYGLLAGVVIYFIGVPNPLLWGVLAAILRFIPYLGIWVAALMPAALTLAVEPGFAKALAIFGIYFGIDMIFYNFVEPFLYGKTTGLTPLAVLAAALFWTWLWGPVGLLLSTPLTVCFVVLGRNVPDLSFLGILLSDEPQPLSPPQRVLERLEREAESDRKAA